MAKKKFSKQAAPRSPQKKQEERPGKNRATPSWYQNKMQLLLVVMLLVITAICFSPVLSSKKEFINFDDPVYISHPEQEVKASPPQGTVYSGADLITKLDGNHLKAIFRAADKSLNYHPITILSFAINHSISGVKPFGYLFTNLLFHILNTFLVFIFLYRLSARKFWVGLISAMLFAIHPMHVESVAWASERKDVLYCFFFLASCITYLSYLESKQIKYFVFCLMLFVLSCLSKAMAVPLPLVLLLIDFYRQRKFTLKSVAEKIPFLLLSLLFGYIAVHIQSKGAMAEFGEYTLAQRFMFASFGFMTYLQKLFLPIGLAAFHPYPTLNEGDVPLIYKIAPAVVIVILAVPTFLLFKKNKTAFRTWLFGIGFFSLMVALVLQFISVGAAITADRYSYLPYIGIAFIIASLLNSLIEKQKTKIIGLAVVFAITPALALACYERVQVWQNDEVLWTDVIEKYPFVTEKHGDVITVIQKGADIAYDNRANYYRMHGDMEKAFADYKVLTDYQAKTQGAYNNMGNIYCIKAQEAASKGDTALTRDLFLKAIDMYSEAIRLFPGDAEAIHNRAITYSGMGEHQKAIDDLTASLALKPDDISVMASLGNEKTQMGRFQEGIDDFNKALAITPDDPNLLYYRGTALVNVGKQAEAINDLTRAVQIKPAMANAWYNLSVAYNKSGNKPMALDAALKAQANGMQVAESYLNMLR